LSQIVTGIEQIRERIACAFHHGARCLRKAAPDVASDPTDSATCGLWNEVSERGRSIAGRRDEIGEAIRRSLARRLLGLGCLRRRELLPPNTVGEG
jgi:hypothetical protein